MNPVNIEFREILANRIDSLCWSARREFGHEDVGLDGDDVEGLHPQAWEGADVLLWSEEMTAIKDALKVVTEGRRFDSPREVLGSWPYFLPDHVITWVLS